MPALYLLHRTILILWAGPNTLLGLIAGGAALLTGGRCQLHSGVLEFHGGWLQILFRGLLGGSAVAMTLGHTILGPTAAALDVARRHELIHVRQYERWGALFLPAYVLSSLWVGLRGGRPYRDNYFEKEAYGDAVSRGGLSDGDSGVPLE